MSPKPYARSRATRPLTVHWPASAIPLPAAGSPAIDAGTGLFAEDATDLDGAARVRGWAIDCGAYEYQTNFAVTGDADAGFVVKPDTNVTDFVATIPTSVDVAKVTIQVAPEIKSVTPNGTTVKVVRTTVGTEFGCLDVWKFDRDCFNTEGTEAPRRRVTAATISPCLCALVSLC